MRPKKTGARATYVSILTGTTKSRFSRICISVISYPINTKFIVKLLSIYGRPHTKFEGYHSSRSRDTSQQNFVFFSSFFSSSSSSSSFSSSFRTLCKDCSNSQARIPIRLKIGTLIGSLKANVCINFRASRIKFEGVISDFMRKLKLNFCHAYRVSRLCEWL